MIGTKHFTKIWFKIRHLEAFSFSFHGAESTVDRAGAPYPFLSTLGLRSFWLINVLLYTLAPEAPWRIFLPFRLFKSAEEPRVQG